MAIRTTGKNEKRSTFNEINITPVTDIFLVLLIIMMVIAPMLDQQGLNLAIPDYVEKTDNTPDDNKILTVTVTEDNKYIIDEEEVPEKSLAIQLKEKTRELGGATGSFGGLMIEADGNSDHGAVVKLMDTARNTGINSISITEI